jgi:hypothetical protein
MGYQRSFCLLTKPAAWLKKQPAEEREHSRAAGADAISEPPQLVVVQHFEEELKRLVPLR